MQILKLVGSLQFFFFPRRLQWLRNGFRGFIYGKNKFLTIDEHKDLLQFDLETKIPLQHLRTAASDLD